MPALLNCSQTERGQAMYKVIIKNNKTKVTSTIICKTREEAEAMVFDVMMSEDYAHATMQEVKED